MSVRYQNAGSHQLTVSIAGTQVHTLCCWARAAAAGATDANLIMLDNGTDTDSSRFGYVDVGPGTHSAVFVQHRTGAGSTAYLPAVSINTWHHLAIVIDGTNQVSYVDGAQVDSRAFNASLRTTGFTVLRMGQNTGGAVNPDNHVQDAMVFTAALTVAQIQQVMRGRIPRSLSANLYGWWPLHGDTPLRDFGPSGRTLSTTGGTPATGTLFAPAAWTRNSQQMTLVPQYNVALVDITGAMSSASSLAGTLGQAIPLTGTGSSASTLAGALSVAIALTGAASSASTLSGAVIQAQALAGAATSASTLSGTLSQAIPLAGGATSASSLAGALIQSQPLAGSATSASSLSGALIQDQPLTGAATSASSFAGTVAQEVGLTGAATSASSLAGSLTTEKPITGSATSASTLAGTLELLVPITGAATSASTLAGSLIQAQALAGTAQSASTLTGNLTQLQALTGALGSGSTLAGNLLQAGELLGNMLSGSTLTGGLIQTQPLTGPLTSSSALAGTLGVAMPLTGSLGSASSLTGSLAQLQPLTGAASSASTLSGALTTAQVLEGSLSSSSRLQGTLSGGTPYYPPVLSGWIDGGDVTGDTPHGAWFEAPSSGTETPHGAWFEAEAGGTSDTPHGPWYEDPVSGGTVLHPERANALTSAARTASTLTATLTNASLQPTLYGTAITGAPFEIEKNWEFGSSRSIANAAALNAEFTYHDPFGTISNGTNYGALMQRAAGAPSFGVYNWADVGMANDQQPEDATGRYRTWTSSTMRCHVKPLDTGSTIVGPADAYNAGCGSFVSKLTLEAGGARLGQTIVWETRCRIVDAPLGYWFALWLVGPQWDGGPEIDVVEAFSSSAPNINGDLFNSNGIGIGPNTFDYFSGGWDDVLETLGLPGYAVPDGAQSLRNWHTFTLEYAADDSFKCWMDSTLIQSGTLDWRLPSGPTVPTLSFLFDFGFGHTGISPINAEVIANINTTPLTYEIDYSRIWLR